MHHQCASAFCITAKYFCKLLRLKEVYAVVCDVELLLVVVEDAILVFVSGLGLRKARLQLVHTDCQFFRAPAICGVASYVGNLITRP